LLPAAVLYPKHTKARFAKDEAGTLGAKKMMKGKPVTAPKQPSVVFLYPTRSRYVIDVVADERTALLGTGEARLPR
jgi:hypothetical protein